MAGKAGLKAGSVGIVVVTVLALIGRFVPLQGVLMWVSTAIGLLAYGAIGALAAWYVTPPRAPGKGAGAGAIAGLISGLVAGIVGVALRYGQIASGAEIPGMTAQQMAVLRQVAESGTSLALILVPSAICVTGIGSALSAIGGAIFSAIRPD